MTLYSILGLSMAMFLLAVVPGPGVFATVSKAISSGFRAAVPVIFGIVIGDFVFLLSAIYGLATIATAFNTLFMLIKYLGAAYLIMLGIKLWRSPPRNNGGVATQSGTEKYSFLVGLSITLGNPKVIVFYLAFLPTFLDLTMLSGTDVAIISLVVSVVLASVLLCYAYMASRVRGVLNSPVAQRRLNKVAGSVMVGTGTVLLTKA